MDFTVRHERGQALSEVGLLIVVVVLVTLVGLSMFSSAVFNVWSVQVARAAVAI